ncbi:MAG TPA: hypothetical protein VFM53_06985 [Anaeromyxobacteraceae bacterium]|nr:hypothetical protein [Anaeromyxobacteraceae bacterium]
MAKEETIEVGKHRLTVRRQARRWMAAVDGRWLPGFFGTEAQALGAALVSLTAVDRDQEAVATGDTIGPLPRDPA